MPSIHHKICLGGFWWFFDPLTYPVALCFPWAWLHFDFALLHQPGKKPSHWSQPQGLRWAGILVHRRICLTTRRLYRAKTMRALWALRGRLSCQISPKVEKMSKYAQIHGIHWNTLLNQVAYKKWLMIFMIWGFLWISGIVNRIITGIIPDSLDAPSLKLKPMVIVSTSLYCVGKESGYRNNYDRDPLKDREVKSWH